MRAEPPEELIFKYINLGFAEEDAAVAAYAQWVGAEYLISENRHFLSRSELVAFEIVNAETALSTASVMLGERNRPRSLSTSGSCTSWGGAAQWGGGTCE